MTCRRSGTTLTSMHSRARRVEQVDHLHVLLGRKRDVQVIDLFPRGDFRRLVDRAEQRQTAIAEMVAGPIVDEADDLVAELAMFDDLVRDETAELARTRR